jgi:MoxR-like ATPase
VMNPRMNPRMNPSSTTSMQQSPQQSSNGTAAGFGTAPSAPLEAWDVQVSRLRRPYDGRVNIQDAAARLQARRAELNARYIERGREVDALLLGALSRHHVLMLGPAGEAKSSLTDALVATFTTASVFKTLCGRDSAIEQFFGMFDMAEFDKGNYKRKWGHMAPGAHFLFLDEIGKLGTTVSNDMLMLLNERQYDDGGTIIDCPLEMCVGASNEMPASDPTRGDNMDAFIDRFLIRVVVNPLSEGGHHQLMDAVRSRRLARATGADVSGKSGTRLTLEELKALQWHALTVEVPDAVLEAWYKIRDRLNQEGLPVPSSRRSEWLHDLIAAHAVLCGRTKATVADLSVLRYALWRHESDIKQVGGIVLEEASPLLAKAQGVLDKIHGTAEEFFTWMRDPANKKDKSRLSVKAVEAKQAIRDLGQDLNNFMLQAKGAGEDHQAIEGMLQDARGKWDAVARAAGEIGF